MNGRLEIGLKLDKREESRPVFLRRGRTTACLKSPGTVPEERLPLIMLRTYGPIVASTSLNSRGGTVSTGEPEGYIVL